MTIEKMELQMRWLGVAGFEFKSNGHTFLIDPFLTRPALKYVFSGRVKPDQEMLSKVIQSAEDILVTHAHYDHLMDVPETARRTGATVYGTPNVCQVLRAFELPEGQIKPLQANESIRLAYGNIVTIRARHPAIPGYLSGKVKKALTPPLRLRDYRMDTCLSFLMELPGIKLLIWSSTSSDDARPADVLFVRAVASQNWYEKILSAVRPRLVIPTHWDNLFQPLIKPMQTFWSLPRWGWPPLKRINLNDFEKNIHQVQPDCKVLIPQPFKSYHLIDEMNS
jgi:L-ascorbate metabolism protein UlaG (beta-lactamase superfamily)